MSSTKVRRSSFSRNFSTPTAFQNQNPGLRCGPNGTILASSGIPDLDKILGGGFALGSLVMMIEDNEAPHHMLLLRNFMSQGLVHNQPLLYSSPEKDPKYFLGTLPNPISCKDDKSRIQVTEQEKALRIAWQYKKYFGENQQNSDNLRDGKHEYCNEFDLRKPLERHLISGKCIECISLEDCANLTTLRDRCLTFLSQLPRYDGNDATSAGRIAIQSFGAPQCQFSDNDWGMLSFMRCLKSMVRSSNSIAVITFPASLVSPSFSKRCQHIADTLISVKAIPDEDKEMAKLLTGYQDMIGLLNIHKVARLNSQVPVIPEATTYSIKLRKRRMLILESLNQAPVDGSSGTSYSTTSSSCSSKTGNLEF